MLHFSFPVGHLQVTKPGLFFSFRSFYCLAYLLLSSHDVFQDIQIKTQSDCEWGWKDKKNKALLCLMLIHGFLMVVVKSEGLGKKLWKQCSMMKDKFQAIDVVHILCLRGISKNMWLSDISGQRQGTRVSGMSSSQFCWSQWHCPIQRLEQLPIVDKRLFTWKFAVFIAETFGSSAQEWVSTWCFVNKSRWCLGFHITLTFYFVFWRGSFGVFLDIKSWDLPAENRKKNQTLQNRTNDKESR